MKKRGHPLDCKWTEVYGSVVVSDINAEVIKLIHRKDKESKECLGHALGVDIFASPIIRRYRMGKNRCVRCGFPIKK
jgi:hypothetical protein